MRQFFIFIFFISGIYSFSQLPVSITAQKKQALIEEFTGNTCTWCPAGHKTADQIANALPGKIFSMNIHSGYYSTPAYSAASKDFRTTQGDSIHNISGMGIGSYPAGIINRRVVTAAGTSPQQPGGWATGYPYFSDNVNIIVAENTYINIAGQAYLHPTTRAMIINMEAYYTSNAPANTSQRINISLLQDNIIAYQSGGSTHYPEMLQTPGDNNTYKHMHVLRKTITPALGETMVGNKTSGTKWSKTYYFTIPTDIPGGSKTIPMVLQDLVLLAYITDNSNLGNVVAVCKVPITITASTDIFDVPNVSHIANNINVYPNPISKTAVAVFTITKEAPATIEIVNVLGQVVKYEKLDALTIGEHKYEFDATTLTNGIYFLNINVDGNHITKKISVLK